MPPFSSKYDLNKSFWENIHYGRVVVWYGVIHFFQSIHSAKLPLFYSSFSSQHPGGKIASVAKNLINSASKQQRQPLSSLLSLSFFNALYWGRLKINAISDSAEIYIGNHWECRQNIHFTFKRGWAAPERPRQAGIYRGTC